MNAALILAIVRLAATNPLVLDTFARLIGNVGKLRNVDPVGFLEGLFDPSKGEANAAALVSAQLDALLVLADVEYLKLALTVAEADRIAATILDEPPPEGK